MSREEHKVDYERILLNIVEESFDIADQTSRVADKFSSKLEQLNYSASWDKKEFVKYIEQLLRLRVLSLSTDLLGIGAWKDEIMGHAINKEFGLPDRKG